MAAALSCAPAGHTVEANCRECRHDPQKRQQWGCDAPTKEPLLHLSPCPFCAGKDDECTHCGGDERGVGVHRCPHATVQPQHVDAVNATLLIQQGIMQDPGGWQDQSNTLVQAFPLLCREIGHWREVDREVQMAKARQKQTKR